MSLGFPARKVKKTMKTQCLFLSLVALYGVTFVVIFMPLLPDNNNIKDMYDDIEYAI